MFEEIFDTIDFGDGFQLDNGVLSSVNGHLNVDQSLLADVPWTKSGVMALSWDTDLDGVPDAFDDYFGPGAHPPDFVGNSQEFFNGPADNGLLLNIHAIGDLHPHEVSWSPSEFDGVGNPLEESEHWNRQVMDDSCGVAAQLGVLESYANTEVSEDKLLEIAVSVGEYRPGCGTFPSKLGTTLENLDLDVKRQYNANLEDIEASLAKGEKVLVGLDCNEIWYPMRDVSGRPAEQPDAGHVVWVTGIDDTSNGKVIIVNDSGLPDGKMNAIPAEDFLNAWGDFDNLFVSVNKPANWNPPEWAVAKA